MTGRTTRICWISKRTSPSTRRISMKEKVLRDTQARSVHEMGEMKRAQEPRVHEFSVQKLRESHETMGRLTSQMQEMQEQMNSMNDSGEFVSRSGIESQWEIVLRSQSTSSDSKFSFYVEPRQTLATWHMEFVWITGKHVLVINFLHLIRPKIIIKEFTIVRHQERQVQFHKRLGQGPLSNEMKSEWRAEFQCRHLHGGRRPWVHYFRWIFRRILWLDSKDSRYRNCNSTNALHLHSFVGR